MAVLTKQLLESNERALLEKYIPSMSFRLYTDPDVELPIPTSVDELETWEATVSTFLQNTNEGKGVPVSYRMASIASVLHQWQRTPSLPTDAADQQRLLEVLTCVLGVQAEADRYHRQLEPYAYCIPAANWRKFVDDCVQYRQSGAQLRQVRVHFMAKKIHKLPTNTILPPAFALKAAMATPYGRQLGFSDHKKIMASCMKRTGCEGKHIVTGHLVYLYLRRPSSYGVRMGKEPKGSPTGPYPL